MANPYYKSTEEYLEEWGNRNTSSGKSVEEYRTNYQNALSAAVQKGEEKRQQSQVQTPVLDASKAAAAERAKRREEKRQAAGVALPSSAVIPGKNNAVMTPGGKNSVLDTVGTFQNIKNEQTGTSGTSGMPSHAPFVSEDAKRENLTTNYQLREPTGAPIAENVQRDMASNMAWLTLSDEERAKRIAEYNDEQIVQQAEIVNKQYDEKMTAYNQANAAYDEWLKKNQSDEVINAMSADYDAPEWVAFRAEGERLYAEAKKYDDEADALRLQADGLHDQALYITEMRRINELLPKMDAETRRAFDIYADTQVATKDFYQRMAQLGVQEGEARRLAETWKRNKNKEGMEFHQQAVKYATSGQGIVDLIDRAAAGWRESAPDALANAVADTMKGTARVGSAVAGSVGSIANGLVSPITGTAAATMAGLTSGRYRSADPNGFLFAPTVTNDTARETTAGMIRGDGKNAITSTVADAYNLAMGAADTVARSIVYGRAASRAVLAMDVYQRTMRDATVSGASAEQAVALGLATAGLEYLTEGKTVENILGVFEEAAENGLEKLAERGMKGYLWDLAKNAGTSYATELPQELISFWGSAAAEAVILHNESDFNRSVRAYKEQGMDEKNAKAAAWKDLLIEGSVMVVLNTAGSVLFQTAFSQAIGTTMSRMAQDSAEGAPPTTTPPTTPPVTQQKATENVQVEKTVQEAQTPTALEMPNAEAVANTQQVGDNSATTPPNLVNVAENGQDTTQTDQVVPMSPADEAALKLAQLTETKDYPGTETKVEPVEVQQQTEQMADEQRNDFAMGAADRNFSGLEKYNDALYDGNIQPERATDARAEEVPKTIDDRKVSESAPNMINSGAIDDETVDMLKREVANGTFSYDTQSMESVVNKAKEEIDKGGVEKAYTDVMTAATTGKHNEHDLAKAQLLFVKYANDKTPGMQERAATMAVAISEMSRSAGRQMNMAKLMRMLTPEGNVEATMQVINRAVDKLNKGRNAKDQVSLDIPQEMQNSLLDAVRDTMSEQRAVEAGVAAAIESTVQDEMMYAADNAIDEVIFQITEPLQIEGQTEGLQTNDMAERVGKRVADTLTRKAKRANLSVEDQLYQDIMRFANDKANANQKKVSENDRNLKALRDYYQYRAFFQAAWDNARARVQQTMNTMKDGDPRLQRLQDFLSTATLENKSPIAQTYDHANPKSTLRAATKEAATKAGIKMANAEEKRDTVRRQMRDVLTENVYSKQEAALQIADIVVDELGLDRDSARKAARDVVQAFFADLQERAANKVASMFEAKDRTKVKKTMMQRLGELYNMGAFSNEDYRQAAFDSLFGEGTNIDIPDSLMQRFVDSADEARSAAEEAIYMAAAAQMKATFKEKYDAWRYMAMLGNIRTQVRNITGNAAFKSFVSLKRNVSAIAEEIFIKDKSKRTKSLLVGKEAKDLLRWAANDAKTKEAQEAMSYSGQTGDQADDKISQYRKIFNNRMVEFARKGVKGVMEFGDMIFKSAEYRNSLASFLKARGITAASLEDGTADQAVVNEARAYAVNEAMKSTFNDMSQLARLLSNVKGAVKREDGVLFKAADFLIEGNLPFLRVPANIVTRAWEYSPAGGVQALITDTGKVKSGEMSAAQLIDKLSASAIGTVVMALGSALAKGIGGIKLIGDEPTEEEKAQGFKAWQLVIGDMGFNIDWLAPTAIPLFVGANLGRLESEDSNLVSQFFSAIPSAFEPMLELSVLSNLSDLLKSGQYAESTSEQFISAAVTAVTGNLRQLVPTVFGHLERAFEDKKTQTYAESEDPFIRSLEKFWGDTTQKLPWDNYQIEQLDDWGDPVDTRSNAAKAVEDLFLPMSHTNKRTDPAKEEYLRVTGEGIGEVKKDISYTKANGETVDRRLTGEEWNKIKTERGKTLRDLVEEAMDEPVYQAMSEAEQKKVMEIIKDYATNKARVDTLDGYTFDSKWMAETKPEDLVDKILTKAYESTIGGSKFSENKHGEMVGAGISDAQAKGVQSAVAGLKPEAGQTNVRTIQQLEAIMDVGGLSENQRAAAMHAYLKDDQDAKMDKLMGEGYGLTVDQFVDTYRAYLDRENAEDGKKDIAAALGVKASDPLVEKVWKAYQGK